MSGWRLEVQTLPLAEGVGQQRSDVLALSCSPWRFVLPE